MNYGTKRKCPICGKEISINLKDSPFGPFCSERCKKIDLLNWLEEKYKIERELKEEDLKEESKF